MRVEEKVIDNAAETGNYFMDHLGVIKSPWIKSVHGRGLMIAVEMKPEAGGAIKFYEELMIKGLMCKETHQHTICMAPPLVIKKQEIEWALEQIESVFS